MKHILSGHDINETDIKDIFQSADEFKKLLEEGKKIHGLLPGKTLATIFYDPSTRTRIGFESAMLKLGGSTVSIENARNSTDDLRGESLEDLIKTISTDVDVIAMRHPEPGSAVRASKVSHCPIINCSDGSNESPIQALQDMYTIQHRKPEAKVVMFVGDIIHNPVVSSFVHFAEIFDMHVIYTGAFSPQQLPPGRHTSISEANLGSYISQADVLYLLGNRLGGISKFKLTLDYLTAMKKDAIVMHPFPRGKELPIDIDLDYRAAYFEQARNGMFIRMAVLDHLLSK